VGDRAGEPDDDPDHTPVNVRRFPFHVFVVCAMATVARAEFVLQWDAPPSCPRPPGVEQVVGEVPGHAEVQLRQVRPDSWTVTILFFEPASGLRRVTVKSCEEAVSTAKLLLRLGSRGAVAPEPEPVEAPPVTPPDPVLPWIFSVHAGAAVDAVSLPKVEPRVAVTAWARHSLLGLALDARFGFPQALLPSVTVRRLVEVQAAGCLNFAVGRLSGGPCLALAAGSWSAQLADRTRETWVLSSELELRGAIELIAGLELGVLAAGRVNLRRPQPYTGDGVVFTTPTLTADLQLTLGWRW
jgi:hypothetical protein